MTYSKEYDIIKTVKGARPRQLGGKEMVEKMTDKQMQFIAWLITTATDKCSNMEEVRKMNEEIRKHSAGLKEESEDKGN